VGGTGKSTLAGTLAWVLAHEGQARVLLLSLGNPPAAVSHFKLSRWPHVGLFLEGKESFERVVQRLPLPLPSSGNAALSVAIAPGGLALYDKIGGRMPDDQGAVMRLVEQAAAHFEIVIADLPPDLSGWAVHPLLAAQDHHHNADVVLVARPTVAGQAGVVQAKALVQSLGRGPACRLHLVLNDYYRGQDLGPKDFVTGVDQMLACPSLAAVVPHGSNNVVRLAQNEGLPLPLAEGTDGVVEGVRRLAVHLGFEMGVEIEIGREGGDRDRERSLESEGVKAGRKRPGISLPGIRIKVTD
jgi:Flp pilus assembly CpaE family ATPase